MGTKRHMAGHVRTVIDNMQPNGYIVDLFSGMGSVAESMHDLYPVITNDALSFAAAISRARFTGPALTDPIEELTPRLAEAFLAQKSRLRDRFANPLHEEAVALGEGQQALAAYMATSRHVGNDKVLAEEARLASESIGASRYCLASLYFSGGYLSLHQAIEIDALRFAIDSVASPYEVDWLLSAWIIATSKLINAPGHTAQFLKPTRTSGYTRIVRAWKRSGWQQFTSELASLKKVGSDSWRLRNKVFVGDALDLAADPDLKELGAFYADPPYTKDQYSRYYHVYETLYKYDFPDSHGEGRVRTDRFSTGFSLKSAVAASFHDLCRIVARRGVPLIISYPNVGLLNTAGWDLSDIASSYFTEVRITSIDARHSTMGASRGTSLKTTTENIYVCTS